MTGRLLTLLTLATALLADPYTPEVRLTLPGMGGDVVYTVTATPEGPVGPPTQDASGGDVAWRYRVTVSNVPDTTRVVLWTRGDSATMEERVRYAARTNGRSLIAHEEYRRACLLPPPSQASLRYRLPCVN